MNIWIRKNKFKFFYKIGYRQPPSPSPYATALLPMGQQTTESVYAKPESICPSRVSYYASSQLTQVTTTTNNKSRYSR